VIIPNGVSAGQTIRVTTPDGTRSMNATVPAGMGPGQVFTITFPAVNSVSHENIHAETMKLPAVQHAQASTPSFSQALDSAYPEPMPPPSIKSVVNSNPSSHFEPVFATAVPAPRAVTPPMATAVPSEPVPSTNSHSGQQALLLVQVPPGCAPGSIIHVEIPGEGRTLAAQVPPGAQSFYVSYIPASHAPVLHTPVPQQQQAPVHQQQPVPATASLLGQTSGRQGLLLVDVPPGCKPGTTLHVSVPNEPGRILAAVVPPGNGRQFQISYEPRGGFQTAKRGMPNGYQQQQQQQQQRTGGNNPNPMNGGYNSNNNNNRNGGGGMGNMMLPFVGGAALGAAGAMTYDHFAHNSSPTYATGDEDGDGADRYATNDSGGGEGGGGDYDGGGDYEGGGDYDGGGDWGGGDWGDF
jgi:hypothetical protein